MNPRRVTVVSKIRILVVDDEIEMLETCRDILASDREIEIVTEPRSRVAAELMKTEAFDLLLADLKMPEMDGLALLQHARKVSPETMVVMFTGFPTVETAVEAVKKGAFDYVTKPFTPDQLRVAVDRALERNRFTEDRFDQMIGKSPAIRRVFRLIERVAATDSDVLIRGESGTGKELVARSIHARGKRRGAHFVPVDCGAIPENLLENELFGHERGAYTGAQGSSMGLLEFAHKGTLFLDEICELHPTLQAKLLRVLQERQFRRVGGIRLIDVDLRIVAATNREIDLEVREKRFREDLFYRINVVRIEVPPLRDRKEDIPLLAAGFLRRYGREWGKGVSEIDPEAMEVLSRFSWPGNVRELQNVIKRAVVLCRGDRVTTEDLPEIFETGASPGNDSSKFFSMREVKVRAFELEYLRSLLARHKGDAARAAEEADLPRGTFYRLLKKHQLRPESFKP